MRFRTLLFLSILFLFIGKETKAQSTQIAPDCVIPFNFTLAAQRAPSSGWQNFNTNGQNGCVVWVVSYRSQGFSVVSLRVESAADNVSGSNHVPDTWGAFSGAIIDGNAASATGGPGVNPNVDNNWGFTMLKGAPAWVSVSLTSKTGSGSISGNLLGWRPHGVDQTTASGGSGGICPADPDTSVQFNDGGNCGGDSNFLWDNTAKALTLATTVPGGSPPVGTLVVGGWSVMQGHNAMGSASVDVDPAPNVGGADTLLLAAGTTFTSTNAAGVSFGFDFNPTANALQGVGGQYEARSQVGNIRNFSFLVGVNQAAYHFGSGTVSNLIGASGIAINAGSGTVNFSPGMYGLVGLQSTGNVTRAASLWSSSPTVSGGGTLGTFYGLLIDSPSGITTEADGLWIGDYSGSGATNSYYEWFDSRGVRRVREDSTFNAVGQAIEALYNPQFAKYTAGAANFERVILGQWSSNIAQIGTEAGGTGTLRQTQIIGKSLIIPTLTAATLATPGNATEAYCSDCTVTSAIDNTCTGSGGGASAFRINGAWKCVI